MINFSPSKYRAAKYVSWYLGVILFFIAFGMGLLTGRVINVKSEVTGTGGQISIRNLINLDRNINHSDTVDFNQFWTVWDKVKAKYVAQPIKDSDLFYGALQGLVYGLNDPYSAFFPPKEAEEFNKSLSGEFSGIGAEIGVKNGQLVIVAPLPDSPAELVGLRSADKIMAIDHRLTAGIDVMTAVSRIRGPSGTTTTLTISRDSFAKPKDFVITRSTINVPSIMYEEKPGKIAVLRIMQFNENTTPDLNRYIIRMQQNGIKGIVLDLRNNPGGYLESAVDMASEWILEGKIVSQKYSNGQEDVHFTRGQHRLKGMKTAVLINGGSASASEIVAGALQDQKVATVLGEKSFGKGSVQDYESFPDGSSLKVTVAEWFTPLGNNINNSGVMPDIEVKQDFEKEAVGQDATLDRAIKVLNSK